jgi:hypothetical protein
MAGLYGQRLDQALVNDGVEIHINLGGGKGFGYVIKPATSANRKYFFEVQKALKPYRRLIEADEADDEMLRPALIPVYAKTVIVDWHVCIDGKWQSGIEAEDGTVLPVTRENLINMLTDLRTVFDQVREDAQKEGLFRLGGREEDAGN